MTDRFDFEQKIMECWRVTDDVDTVIRALESNPNQDTLANALIGISALYTMKFEELFTQFEKMIKNGQIK